MGEPSNSGALFFNRDFEFKLVDGQYQPYAFTVDPWANPTDQRVQPTAQVGGGQVPDQYGAATFEWEANGDRYEATVTLQPFTYEVFVQTPGSEIMTPVYSTTSGDWVHWFPDGDGNVWAIPHTTLTGGTYVEEFPLTGYSATGAPVYGSPVNYGVPPGLVDVRHVDVEGSTIYVSGFSRGDTDSTAVWNNGNSIGMTIERFDALPTSAGWGSPAWTTDPIYTLPSDDTNVFPEPFGFAVDADANLVGVAMFEERSNQPGFGASGALKEYSATTGAYVTTLNPPLAGPDVTVGDFDGIGSSSAVAKNGCFWLEDDSYTRIIGICS